jgi:hypothetical protein
MEDGTTPWEEKEAQENNPFSGISDALKGVMNNPEMVKERISRIAIELIAAKVSTDPKEVVRIAFQICDEIDGTLLSRTKN